MIRSASASVRRPKLVVFDLDYTLWPFWVDTHVDPPFRLRKDGNVEDRNKRIVEHYPDTPAILKKLHCDGYTLAVASRTGATDDANSLLKLFDWDKYFTYKEIYPGSKVAHFKRFHIQSDIDYKDMIFFDDEHRNIVETGKLGVYAVLVEDGVTNKVVQDALDYFAKNR